jgi:hypothetical protein
VDLKKLLNCDCGPTKFDYRNSATLCSLLPIPLLSGTFSSAQDGFKNQPTIFLELSVSLETQNLPYRDSCTRFYTSDFFFMNPRPDSTAKNMPISVELKFSDCGLEVADIRKNCDCGIAEQHSLKVAVLRLRKCLLQVAELRLRTFKKVARTHI